MNQFKQMWIPCTEAEYPEVKALLEGMGYVEINRVWIEGECAVKAYEDGEFQSFKEQGVHPTVTLPELRAMAPQPKIIDWHEALLLTPPPQSESEPATEHLETLFLNFIEAVAEMREAQKQYYKTPQSRRPEAIGFKLKLETQVDQMIQDVTRKPDAPRP